MRRIDADRTIHAIGARIAELRIAAGLTQEKLAERVGVSDKYIQRVEAGANLSIRSLVRFANALGVPFEKLIAGSGGFDLRR